MTGELRKQALAGPLTEGIPLARFLHAAHRTGRADLPHPALGAPHGPRATSGTASPTSTRLRLAAGAATPVRRGLVQLVQTEVDPGFWTRGQGRVRARCRQVAEAPKPPAITPPLPPALEVSAESLEIDLKSAQAVLILKNTGGKELRFRLLSDSKWLSADPAMWARRSRPLCK